MSGQTVLIAKKRYKRDFFVTMAFYTIAIIGGPLFLNSQEETPEKWMLAAVAILCAVPAAYIFILMWRLMKETDEYIRQRMTSAMILSAGFIITFCFLWGFLELYELVPEFPTFLTGPLFFSTMGVVQIYRKVTGQ